MLLVDDKKFPPLSKVASFYVKKPLTNMVLKNNCYEGMLIEEGGLIEKKKKKDCWQYIFIPHF